MTKVVVAYHSGFGHTAAIAKSIVDGAASVDGVGEGNVALVDVTGLAAPDFETKAYESAWDVLFEADAIVFGSPTYMGTISGPFKMFMDATSAAWFGQRWKDVVAGGFTCSASYAGDKVNTLQTLGVFAMQHSMVWVGTGQMPEGKGEGDMNRMGSFFGLMAQADSDKGPDVHPPAGDHASARAYGERIALVAKRMRSGAGEGAGA